MDFLFDNSTTPQDPQETSQLHDIARMLSQLPEAQSSNEEFLTRLCHVCNTVNHMLQDLCKRDNRFLYLRDALVEFIDGDLGLNDRLGRQTQHVELAHSMDGDDDSPIAAARMQLEWLIHDRTLWKQDIAGNYRFDFQLGCFEIISSVIFEILNVFDLDVDVEEFMIEYKLPAYTTLLKSLYHRTRDCKPKVATPKTTPNTPYQALSEFIYKSKLSPGTDQVRVVEICPGSLDDPIECNLKVRSIKDDGIPEALSYVWGTEMSHEDILVDLQLFSVTRNLFEILRSLRHPNTTRTIWIDAICINQSDFEEKGRQVRLMRDIYSNANRTVIYLTGAVDAAIVSIPPNFGGTTIDRYDLASILIELRKYPLDSSWGDTPLALCIMLLTCIREIISHAWWERIWTLQEGALPPSAPIFYYRDYSFTFDDFEGSLDILMDMDKWSQEKKDHLLSQASRNPAIHQVLSTLHLVHALSNGSPPLLYYLRRYGQDYAKESSSAHRLFFKLLWDTDTYRSTDPRDKIYALESLLPRGAGKLIRIDYGEDYETVFACATARCFNSFPTLNIAGKFSLLIERKTNTITKDLSTSGREAHSAPSWTIDFSYCASEKRTNKSVMVATDPVTLNGFLYHQSNKYVNTLDRSKGGLVFATPRTLFCSGVDIDRIYETGKIPEIGPDNLFLELLFFANDIQKRLRSRLPNFETPHLSSNSFEEATQLIAFFTLHTDKTLPPGDFEDFLNVRFKEVAGRTYFITEQGLLGISTAPVQQGDSLCLLHDACVYFVLRDVPDEGTSKPDSKLEAAQKHRIVARAAVQEKTTDIPSLMASLPSRRFQII
ncbi:hypothetical protein NPX13_g5090 [Xylaria arbuscula]|uniref:Heterokaryon incompatibility domain-containing protein n=1 Tax=Xylaria arbuscula TaxID=114810 RepID=A0A9W8NF52_9PEZI|nr:hypothetical protein NPX13_g5090 [Xylaria arbuscula]